MFSVYNLFMRPLEAMGIKSTRRNLMKEATGNVLEVGAGTGANIPFYNFDNIQSLTLTDQKISKHIKSKQDNVTIVEADATALPFEDNSFDCVVHTLVFCSVDNVHNGLSEIKRVLKPDGKLIFIEHVLPHKRAMKGLFVGMNPLWKTFSHGCSLTRDFKASLADEKFKIVREGTFLNTVFIYGIATTNKVQ